MIKNKYFRIGSLAGGMRVEEVAEEYGIEKEDVLAAMEYLYNCSGSS